MNSGACKVVYVINHAAFFASHRLPLAMDAIRRGWKVALFTGKAGSDSMEAYAERTLRSNGIRHVRVAFTPAGINPLVELRGLVQLVRLMRRERPDIVHCASPKGILYGAIAARAARVKGLVLAVSGMGFAFTADRKRNLFRSLAALAYRWFAQYAYGHRNKRIIVQNSEDLQLMLDAKLGVLGELVLIPGSGVDIRRLGAAPIEQKSPTVLFAARMVSEKGVLEFVEAARIVRRTFPAWRFVMAGAADYQNPSSVPADILKQYHAEGVIDWHGLVEDMHQLYSDASIVCLPSYYREGMPKVLLEAAAAGCAVVTTDLPGCREAIVPGVTGDLVPPRNVEVLARVLGALISDRVRREEYGRQGRRLASERFSIDAVVERVMGIYQELLSSASSAPPK